MEIVQTIILAKRYNKLPSEILRIEYDYLAYMIDEVCLYLEDKATDKKGNIDWDKLIKVKNPNQEMIEHIKSMQR